MKEVVVYVSGCWDLFHTGHLNFFEGAKKLGDVLIVGVNTDEAILRYKGHLPVIPLKERMKIVEALQCVDVVLPHTLGEIEVFEKYKVDIVVRNPNYPVYEHNRVEKEYLQKTGREIVILPFTEGIFTTEIIKSIKQRKDL